jgi:hypothetical protein
LNIKPLVPRRGELRLKRHFVWIYSKDEVEDIEFEFVLKHRSLPFGKGVGGLGLRKLNIEH